MIHKAARHLFSRGAGTDVMDEDDTGQEMQKEMEIKCEVEWNEGEDKASTSTIAIKREIGRECDVKTEISEDGNLPSNPLMVAANQFHNLKVQFEP